MIVERLARPSAESSPRQAASTGLRLMAGLRQAWDVFWPRLCAHMADVHGLPRDEAVERPPRAHN